MKTSTKWLQLIFSFIWFLGAGIILFMYLTNSLPKSFVVPKFIKWLYDLSGVLVASIIQLIICLGVFIESLPKKEKRKNDEKN